MTNTTNKNKMSDYPGTADAAIDNLRNTINEQAKVIHQLEMVRADAVIQLNDMQVALDSLKQSLQELRELKQDRLPFLVEANTFLDRWTGDT